MKRRFFSIFNFTLFAGLLVLLSSCSGLTHDTGSATFSIPADVLKAAIENASINKMNQNNCFFSNDELLAESQEEDQSDAPTEDNPLQGDTEEDYDNQETIELKVSLRGKYEQTITKVFTFEELDKLHGNEESKASSVDITFSNIPVGSTVYAEATLTIIYNFHGKQEKNLIYKGTSDYSIRITAGSNPLKLTLKECNDFILYFYIEDDTVKETETDERFP